MENRNFSTISPSAKALLLLKGYTNIPYAREAARLMKAPEQYEPDYSNRDFYFWIRVLHFESRYWSIDELLNDLPIKNILELSSGFSFQGLAMTQEKDGIHYIDTDLPDIINTKKAFIDSFEQKPADINSHLTLTALNALDEDAFIKIVDSFPPGEIAIVNEGLLMYLNREEKKRLCAIIHKVLQKRGGYWITADVYTKFRKKPPEFVMSDLGKDFFKQHNIEANKFESFEDAEIFFKEQGFEKNKIAKVDKSKLVSLNYLKKSASLIKLIFLAISTRKVQATWRLKIKKQ